MSARVHVQTLTVLLAALLLGIAGGCSRDERGASSGEASDARLDRLLNDAPDEPGEFRRWAGKQLAELPAPVPMPVASMPPAKWTLVRLDDPERIASARVQTGWSPSASESTVLAEAGPLRSDRPDDWLSRRVTKESGADGSDALELRFGGFRVRSADVGSILLRVHAPYGRHIVLSWSKAGQITIPIPTHDASFPVRIPTDGLAEWNGPLTDLTLLTDGVAEQPVVLDRLALLSRVDAFPLPLGVSRTRIGSEIRTAVYSHTPTEVRFDNVVVPPSGRMHLGLGVVSDEDGDASFEISVVESGQATIVLNQAVASGASWRDARVELAEWSDRTVSIVMKAGSALRKAVVLWSNPVLYEPIEAPPVTVLYLIDTLAAEHVDLYGYSRATTPRLSALSASGANFRNAVSNSSRTVESIPDMMLSMPVERHGVHHNSTPAAAELVTLAECMRSAGYATISLCTNVNAGPRQGMDQGFETFIDKIGYYWSDGDRTIPLEDTVAWIDSHADRPMFIYVHTAEPHAPYTPPEGFAGRFDANYTGRINGTYNRERGFRNIRNPQTQARDLEHVIALYDEEILYSDTRLGLFLDEMNARGILPRCHFMLVSDHGEEFLQHGMWEHGLNLHNEQTRIPFVVVGPGVTAGLRVDTPVQILDVMPTILELAGVAQPYPLDGRSLCRLLRGEDDPQLAARDVFLSNHNYRISHKLIEHAVIESGRWKLVYGWREWPIGPGGGNSHWVLFDLSSDPRERNNAIGQQPDVARRLMEKLLRHLATHPPYGGVADLDQYLITPEQIADLQNLGYVGGEAIPGQDDATEAPASQPPP